MGSEYLVPSIQERDLIYLIVLTFVVLVVFLLCIGMCDVLYSVV